MTLVSVIVPVYNAEIYIKECIESILNQVYESIEVIMINDGSTDSSGQICEYYEKKDSRVRCIHSDNRGVSAARNLGIKYSRGDYIHFVDSDDTIDPEMISLLVEAATEKQSDLVICGYKRHKFVDNLIANTTVIEHLPYSGGIKGFLIDLENIMSLGLIQGPCWKLYKKNIIEQNNLMFPLEISFGEDTLFVYDYLINIDSVTILNRSLYNYHNHHDSSLSRNIRTDKSQLYIQLYTRLNQVIRTHELENIDNSISKLFLKSLISSFGELYSDGSTINFHDRKKIIKDIIDSEKAQRLLSNFDSREFILVLIFYLIKKRKVNTIDFIFFLRKKIFKKR